MGSTAPAIGIDLGTTFSCVGVLQDGKVHIINNEENTRTTPSVVAFTDNGRVVGARAKTLALIDPENTLYNIKRLIGLDFNEDKVQNDIKRFPFKVVDDGDGKAKVRVTSEGNRKNFRPEEISAMVLREMRMQAEKFLGVPVKNAVITVPAYFSDVQRQATQDAGKIAGLNVLGIINEPTAAALAYGFDNMDDDNQHTVLIYDFGGGTFDVSVLNIQNGNLEVCSTGGDSHLGGEDIDNFLLDHFCKEFTKQHKLDLVNMARTGNGNETERSDASKSLRRLKNACEKAKIKLSFDHNARVELDRLYKDNDFEAEITRQWFERLIEDFVRGTLATVQQVLGDANLTRSSITDVILVGGSTRIPAVRDMIKDYFRGKEPLENINPDEAVAYGAAIQAAILSGVDAHTVRNIHLRDVTPLSLGIDTFGGVMASIIRRNTPVPVIKTKRFSTSRDNQTSLCFQVFEGERSMTEYNNLLGEFTLVGIPPAPRRIPQIEVQFSVDANGILKVTAMDLSTERGNGIEITNNRGRLSLEEIERAIQEAEQMRASDMKERRRINSRETLEIYVNKIDTALKNVRFREKIEPEDIDKITEKLSEASRLFEDLEEADEAEFGNKRIELEELWTPLVTRLYQTRASGNQAPPAFLNDTESFVEAQNWEFLT